MLDDYFSIENKKLVYFSSLFKDDEGKLESNLILVAYDDRTIYIDLYHLHTDSRFYFSFDEIDSFLSIVNQIVLKLSEKPNEKGFNYLLDKFLRYEDEEDGVFIDENINFQVVNFDDKLQAKLIIICPHHCNFIFLDVTDFENLQKLLIEVKEGFLNGFPNDSEGEKEQ